MPMTESAPLRSRGQSMTEVAFLLPVLLLLILGAVDVAQVLSAQQHLEQATYVAALRLRSTPSLGTDSTRLGTFIQTESGLAPVTAGTSYSVGGDGSDQVVVTATFSYPLILPGLGKLLTGKSGSGTWKISVSRASVATTDRPAVGVLPVPVLGQTIVQVTPPSGTTVPSGLTLTCALYQDGTPVPTPTPAPALPCTWDHTYAAGTTYTYTATVMQVNGITSPPSTPVTGP